MANGQPKPMFYVAVFLVVALAALECEAQILEQRLAHIKAVFRSQFGA